uniref:Uncharacterized protein n=1 Tax=Vespula pensylvanica TaxID=30213 RepID=A0A834JI20_VESPE|nr:hypothetical protein H0235_018274 [Vespula pensylvanica]
MAVTALSVAISCSRNATSPSSLVTIPEVLKEGKKTGTVFPKEGLERGRVEPVVELSSRYTNQEAVEAASQTTSPRNIKRYVPRNSITIRRYSLAEVPDEMRYCD